MQKLPAPQLKHSVSIQNVKELRAARHHSRLGAGMSYSPSIQEIGELKGGRLSTRINSAIFSIASAANLGDECNEFQCQKRNINAPVLTRNRKSSDISVSGKSTLKKINTSLGVRENYPLLARNGISFTETDLISRTSETLCRLGNEFKKCVSTTVDEAPIEEDDNFTLAEKVSNRAEKISKDREELEKIKKQLRSAGVMTNSGIKQLLPSIIDPKIKEDAETRIKQNNNLNKKAFTLTPSGSVMMEKDTCGIKWNTVINARTVSII